MGVRNRLICALLVLGFSGCTGTATTDRPARTIKVGPNQKVTFESDAAQAGDKIVCIVDGTPVGAVVPQSGQFAGAIADPAYREGSAVSVNISNQGGVLTVECIVE
jgi:hypothetical protein